MIVGAGILLDIDEVHAGCVAVCPSKRAPRPSTRTASGSYLVQLRNHEIHVGIKAHPGSPYKMKKPVAGGDRLCYWLGGRLKPRWRMMLFFLVHLMLGLRLPGLC